MTLTSQNLLRQSSCYKHKAMEGGKTSEKIIKMGQSYFGDDELKSLFLWTFLCKGVRIDYPVDPRNGAMELMKLLDEQEHRLHVINTEFLVKFEDRNENVLMDAIKKLENENEKRRKVAYDEEKKRRVFHSIFVDLVRKIRRRRSPQAAIRTMTMLLGHQQKLQEIHKELRAKVKERVERSLTKTLLHLELVVEVNKRENIVRLKEENQKEMMRDQIEKPDEGEDFCPRKLFLFGIDRLKIESKENKKRRMPDEKKVDHGRHVQYHVPAEKPKAKTSIMNRLKKFFGFV